jgi:hypothetical protein
LQNSLVKRDFNLCFFGYDEEYAMVLKIGSFYTDAKDWVIEVISRTTYIIESRKVNNKRANGIKYDLLNYIYINIKLYKNHFNVHCFPSALSKNREKKWKKIHTERLGFLIEYKKEFYNNTRWLNYF